MVIYTLRSDRTANPPPTHSGGSHAPLHKLRILILKHIDRGERSGYGLIKDIAAATGWRPSYGSVYPLLEQLRRQGLVRCRAEGKSKLYALTATGKSELRMFLTHHNGVIDHMREMQKVLTHLCGTSEDPSFDYIVAQLENGEVPFKEIQAAGYALRGELARIGQEGLLRQRKDDVNAILEDATGKLKKIVLKEQKTRQRQ